MTGRLVVFTLMAVTRVAAQAPVPGLLSDLPPVVREAVPGATLDSTRLVLSTVGNIGFQGGMLFAAIWQTDGFRLPRSFQADSAWILNDSAWVALELRPAPDSLACPDPTACDWYGVVVNSPLMERFASTLRSRTLSNGRGLRLDVVVRVRSPGGHIRYVGASRAWFTVSR